jgi:hypothetical protein
LSAALSRKQERQANFGGGSQPHGWRIEFTIRDTVTPPTPHSHIGDGDHSLVSSGYRRFDLAGICESAMTQRPVSPSDTNIVLVTVSVPAHNALFVRSMDSLKMLAAIDFIEGKCMQANAKKFFLTSVISLL